MTPTERSDNAVAAATPTDATPPALHAFVTKHRASTTQHTRAMHDALAPLARVVAQAKRHVTELEEELLAAELAEHDHALDGKLNFMRTRLRSVSQRADMLIEVGRDLALAMTEVERGLASDIADVHRVVTMIAPAVPDAANPVAANPVAVADTTPGVTA